MRISYIFIYIFYGYPTDFLRISYVSSTFSTDILHFHLILSVWLLRVHPVNVWKWFSSGHHKVKKWFDYLFINIEDKNKKHEPNYLI